MADTVSNLLAASRGAHASYRQAVNGKDASGKHQPNYRAAERFVAEALRLRLAAHALDPSHVDGAWEADRGTHGKLIEFYQRYPLIP